MLKSAALIAAAAPAIASTQDCSSGGLSPAFLVRKRLDQGPFDIEQDEGWRTALFTTPSEKPLRNPGIGLVGYTWEENGPALAVRDGKRKLADEIEQLASLPFVDVLYIRCDWRNVQSRPGRLDLDPVWPLTLDAAKRHGLRVAFRVQLSNPEFCRDLPGRSRAHKDSIGCSRKMLPRRCGQRGIIRQPPEQRVRINQQTHEGLFPARQFFIRQRLKELRPHAQFAAQRARLPAAFAIGNRNQPHHRLRPARDNNLFPLAGLLYQL